MEVYAGASNILLEVMTVIDRRIHVCRIAVEASRIKGAEINIQVFGLDRPLRREHPFHAAARTMQ